MKFCYTYDNMERLLTATVERDGTGPVLLCGNTLDELSLSHDGNQLRRVTDQCAGLAYEGAMDFKDGADAATEYSYDACGNMTSNPIRNIDPSGMYYNSADSTQAAMYINMLEGRKKALDESDVTDKNEQLAEIDKSLQNIEDMRNDPNRRYTFQEADAPETTVLKDGTILMKISPETGENFAHEIRHGGQVARGEYGYVKNEPDSRYGASHEISAYRAQLSSYGKISYMPDYGGDKMIELKIAVYGQMHVWKTITNLDEISVNFIMSICERPGLNVKPIYKYGKEWFGR